MSDMTEKGLPGATDVFHNAPTRLIDEGEERAELAGRALSYCNAFLDDALRGILPHDLIVLGAPTGLGKTELALAIAVENATKENRVGYFALEAEPRELERRMKFAWISAQAWKRRIDRVGQLNYADWLLHRCEDIVGGLDAEADAHIAATMTTFWSFYRGAKFDASALCKQIQQHHGMFDLIVVDHLHYVDADQDQDEHRALGDTVKVVRDVALNIGKPIILVAHLRKRDQRLKALVPAIDDFHGSSNITKICTQVITLERATVVEAPKWFLAPTFMSVLKDRRQGAPPYIALTMFDKRTRRYADTYTLGRLTKGGTAWEPLKPLDTPPDWARGHAQLQLELAQ